jgi:small subunit ribosomal protein S20
MTKLPKAARVSQKKRVRNRAAKSEVKTYILRARKSLASGEPDPQEVKEAIKRLDRAARKRIIHPNAASRHKSRLMRSLNQTLNQSPKA